MSDDSERRELNVKSVAVLGESARRMEVVVRIGSTRGSCVCGGGMAGYLGR